MAFPSYCGALSSCWNASSWRSCADSMNGLPDGPFKMLFANSAPNNLADNRSALSTPDTSSVAKGSRLTTSAQYAFPQSRRLQPWKRALAIWRQLRKLKGSLTRSAFPAPHPGREYKSEIHRRFPYSRPSGSSLSRRGPCAHWAGDSAG